MKERGHRNNNIVPLSHEGSRFSSKSISSVPPSDVLKAQVDADGNYCVEWVKDELRDYCKCEISFSFRVWKHHCRVCGDIYCHSCSQERRYVQGYPTPTPQRVCKYCLAIHEKMVQEERGLLEDTKKKMEQEIIPNTNQNLDETTSPSSPNELTTTASSTISSSSSTTRPTSILAISAITPSTSISNSVSVCFLEGNNPSNGNGNKNSHIIRDNQNVINTSGANNCSNFSSEDNSPLKAPLEDHDPLQVPSRNDSRNENVASQQQIEQNTSFMVNETTATDERATIYLEEIEVEIKEETNENSQETMTDDHHKIPKSRKEGTPPSWFSSFHSSKTLSILIIGIPSIFSLYYIYQHHRSQVRSITDRGKGAFFPKPFLSSIFQSLGSTFLIMKKQIWVNGIKLLNASNITQGNLMSLSSSFLPSLLSSSPSPSSSSSSGDPISKNHMTLSLYSNLATQFVTTLTIYTLNSFKKWQSLLQDTSHYLGIGFPVYLRKIHLVHVNDSPFRPPLWLVSSFFSANLRKKK